MSRKNVVSSSINLVSTIVYISFLLNLAIAAKPKGFSMKMIRSNSKESPLHPRYANLTQGERFQGLVKQSKARVRHLGSARAAAYNKSSSMNPDIVPVQYVDDNEFYIGEVGLGISNDGQQPFQNYYLIIDTGSDLMWTQCHGGDNYFYQDPPFYDQEGSSTYSRIPCQDLDVDECDEEHCEDGFCTYKVEYASGQETFGHLAYERFTMNSIIGEHARESVEDRIMGCGINQRNFGSFLRVPEIHDGDDDFPPPIPAPGTAPIAGILGLGQGSSNFSLVRQLDIEKQFEYCLQSYDLVGADVSHTYLRFGSDAIIGEGPEVLTTPIIQDPEFGTPYHLILEDISVGNRRLWFEKSVFEIGEDGTGGTIIDSGTPFTLMIRRHYERVEEVVLEHFEELGIRPADPEPGFKLCFPIPDNFDSNELPTMTFHFQGADFVINQWSGNFVYFVDINVLCFGIIVLDDDEEGDYLHAVYLGAMQQANKRILYNLRNMELSFTDEQCILGS
ncbi:aspartic proteinase nepenthesin-1-like [Papaver somniferum]|uniref:aspartic proteinase nepenthesin-1-like n=1 Tax=Papaver somniferum TaxID=3469 RepID=UPI000E6F4823|nr:aspartic proteinase nepenthesin-1-like [Papaver somniferum]